MSESDRNPTTTSHLPELILVRHGESAMNAGVSTDPDCELTPRGLAQARELAGRLTAELAGSHGTIGVVSPYRRALQTAAAITEASGFPFEIDDGVREWGRHAIVAGRDFPEEPIDAVVERLRDFLDRRRGQRLLVVSHATPIVLLAQIVAGEALVTTGQFWAGVENCCLWRVGRRL